MALRIVVFGREGDGAAFAAMGQVRQIVRELKIEANVMIVTDPMQMQAAGVDSTPAVSVDNNLICQGYVPSRTEMARALGMRVEQAAQAKRGE
jgi:hypothetical protein